MSNIPEDESVRGEPIRLYSYHPFTKEFVGETVTEPDPRDESRWVYPAFTAIIAPPEIPPQKAAVFDEAANIWQIAPDHRGEIWYREDGGSVQVTTLGDPRQQGLLDQPPPAPEKPEEIPICISRRQFFQQAAISKIISQKEALDAMAGDVPAIMRQAINALPEDFRFSAEALIVGATEFNRTEPLVENVAYSLGMEPAEVKKFWSAAALL